jgi:hypothetical protein
MKGKCDWCKRPTLVERLHLIIGKSKVAILCRDCLGSGIQSAGFLSGANA